MGAFCVWWCISEPIRSQPNFSALLEAPPIESARFQPIIADNIAPHHHENVQSRAAPHLPYVRLGSKADLNLRMLKVGSSINSGHSPEWPSGFFVLKTENLA